MRAGWLRETTAGHWRAMIVATGVAAAVVAACLVWSRPAAPAGPGGQAALGPAVGFSRVTRPAPAFDLPSLDGRGSVRLSALRGRPVVVNFWSSSCGPCQRESPNIARVAAAVRGQVTFVGIDTFDSRTAARAFAARTHMTYLLGYDPAGSAASRYRVPALPETVFLASSGSRILGVDLGALTVAHLSGILHDLYGITTCSRCLATG
jgi:cytochrome c biogenesis protein CcmG/thiol:disulfide interchange protein DsbE